MRKNILSVVLAASFVGLPAIVGCDDTIEHEKKVTEKSDGTRKVEEKKTVEKPDGTIEKTTEKKTEQK